MKSDWIGNIMVMDMIDSASRFYASLAATASAPASKESPPEPTLVTFAETYQAMAKPQLRGGDSLEGLGPGSQGPGVARLQKILKKWNRNLGVEVTGRYDAATEKGMALYRAIYTQGSRGKTVDSTVAGHLQAMEDGSFWKNPPTKTAGQKLLYEAAQQLGKPYHLGGDGHRSTDCGLLTSQAAHRGTGVNLSRMADEQYRQARDQEGLKMTARPGAGDLLFYRIPTSQSSIAYGGVTHVGIHVDEDWVLAASSGAGRVVIQSAQPLKGFCAGAGRLDQ